MALPVRSPNPKAGPVVKFNPISKSDDVTLTFNGKTFKITRLTLRKDGVEKVIDPRSVKLDELARCCEEYFNLIKPTIDSNSSEVSFTFKQKDKNKLELRQIQWINPGKKDPHIQEIVPDKTHQILNAKVFKLVQHIFNPKALPKHPKSKATPLVALPPPPSQPAPAIPLVPAPVIVPAISMD